MKWLSILGVSMFPGWPRRAHACLTRQGRMLVFTHTTFVYRRCTYTHEESTSTCPHTCIWNMHEYLAIHAYTCNMQHAVHMLANMQACMHAPTYTYSTSTTCTSTYKTHRICTHRCLHREVHISMNNHIHIVTHRGMCESSNQLRVPDMRT